MLPSNPRDPASWKEFFNSNKSGTECEHLAYYFSLYDLRHQQIRTRQQFDAAVAYVLMQDPKHQQLSPHLKGLCTCVDCGLSAVCDGDKHGRLLPCGHIMHAVCMATHCGEGDNLPTCKECKEPYIQVDVTAETMLQYSNLDIAVRVLQANTPEKRKDVVKKKKEDAKVSNFKIKNKGVSELERAVLEEGAMESDASTKKIIGLCRDTAAKMKAEYLAIAKACIAKLGPELTKNSKDPVRPSVKRSAPSNDNNDSVNKKPKTNTSRIPPNLQADVLPEGSSLTQPVNNFLGTYRVMATKYDGKCGSCKRAMVAGKTLIASSPGSKFKCTICTMGRTSKEVYDAITTQTVPDNFVKSPPKQSGGRSFPQQPRQQPQQQKRQEEDLKNIKPPPIEKGAQKIDATKLLF